MLQSGGGHRDDVYSASKQQVLNRICTKDERRKEKDGTQRTLFTLQTTEDMKPNSSSHIRLKLKRFHSSWSLWVKISSCSKSLCTIFHVLPKCNNVAVGNKSNCCMCTSHWNGTKVISDTKGVWTQFILTDIGVERHGYPMPSWILNPETPELESWAWAYQSTTVTWFVFENIWQTANVSNGS